MKNAWRYIAIGVAVYFLILLATFPADRLTGILEQKVDGIKLRAVSGSIFTGRAGQLLWQGSDLGSAEWSLQPLRLLLGAAEYRLDLRHPQSQGSTRLGMTLLGKIYGRELELRLAPESIINRFVPLPVTAGGELNVQLERFVPAGKIPVEVQGTLAWRGAVVSDPVELTLGDIEFSLNSVDDNLVATLTQGGVLDASGEIKLSANGRYAVDLLLQPGTGVSGVTVSMLETVARKQPGGKFQLTASGSM